MSIELPPLRPFDPYECDGYPAKIYCDDGLYVTVEEVEARERILLARVAELEADAERYRWLRRKVCIIAKPGAAFEFLDFPLPTHVAPCAGIELDAAIDAIEAMRTAGGSREFQAAFDAAKVLAAALAGNKNKETDTWCDS